MPLSSPSLAMVVFDDDDVGRRRERRHRRSSTRSSTPTLPVPMRAACVLLVFFVLVRDRRENDNDRRPLSSSRRRFAYAFSPLPLPVAPSSVAWRRVVSSSSPKSSVVRFRFVEPPLRLAAGGGEDDSPPPEGGGSAFDSERAATTSSSSTTTATALPDDGTAVDDDDDDVAPLPPPAEEEDDPDDGILTSSSPPPPPTPPLSSLFGSDATLTTALETTFLLNVVAIVWGSQHPIIKTVVDDANVDPSSFSLARFGLASVVAAPCLPGLGLALRRLRMLGAGGKDDVAGGIANGMEEEDDDATAAYAAAWRWGLEMGTWMFLGYAFQAIGLETTTAQRSGFLLYLNVKFVPFVNRLFFGRRISPATWTSAFVALAGTALLAYDDGAVRVGETTGSLGNLGPSWNVGDLWSIAAAAASAMFILRLETATVRTKDGAALNAASLWTVTALSFVWSTGGAFLSLDPSSNSADAVIGVVAPSQTEEAFSQRLLHALAATSSDAIETLTSHPLALLYLGVIATALANYVQTKAQRNVTAERASVIYAMDPVYGAVFSNVILGETLGMKGTLGAGLIALAAATNAFLDLGSKEEKEEEGKGAEDTDKRTKEGADVSRDE